MRAEQHHQTADHLDRVADEHHSPFGQGVGKGAHQWRQHHVEDGKDRHQCRALPFGRSRAPHELDRHDKDRVVGQRRKELGRHDRVETALHRWAGWPGGCWQ
jgi:hypothetical protein